MVYECMLGIVCIVSINARCLNVLMREYRIIQRYNRRQGMTEEKAEESLLSILKRDAKEVGMKIKYTLIMLPSDRQSAIQSLKEWDMWGPLIICLLFSLSIGLPATSDYNDFVNVWVIFWMGCVLASINCRLLGSKGSVFQFASVIGYCMLPICILGVIVSAVPAPAPLRIVIVLLGLLWSLVSCMIVIRDLACEEKKFLCAYPILLFYIFMAWYAIVA